VDSRGLNFQGRDGNKDGREEKIGRKDWEGGEEVKSKEREGEGKGLLSVPPVPNLPLGLVHCMATMV